MKNNNKLNIAIVGLGSIGRRHLRLVREFRPGIKITVVRSGEGKSVSEEKIANENNQKLMTLPDGSEIETFEFANKTMQADFDGVLSIGELYERVQMEDE